MSDVIFGAAFGYRPEQLRAFLASAREHVPHAMVVLLRERPDPAFLASTRVINPNVELYVPGNWRLMRFWDRAPARGLTAALLAPILSRLWVKLPRLRPALEWCSSPMTHVVCSRFFALAGYLRTAPAAVNGVAVIDTRDVVFQADPFRHRPAGIVTGAEPKHIGGCEFNTWWVCQMYDWGQYAALRQRPVLCAGVTVGERLAVQNYLRRLIDEIMTHLPTSTFRFGPDQAAHNKLVYIDDVIAFRLAGPDTVRIANLTYADQPRLDAAGNVLDADGVPFDIVHQYDRHPALLATVAARYPAPETPTGR